MHRPCASPERERPRPPLAPDYVTSTPLNAMCHRKLTTRRMCGRRELQRHRHTRGAGRGAACTTHDDAAHAARARLPSGCWTAVARTRAHVGCRWRRVGRCPCSAVSAQVLLGAAQTHIVTQRAADPASARTISARRRTRRDGSPCAAHDGRKHQAACCSGGLRRHRRASTALRAHNATAVCLGRAANGAQHAVMVTRERSLRTTPRVGCSDRRRRDSALRCATYARAHQAHIPEPHASDCAARRVVRRPALPLTWLPAFAAAPRRVGAVLSAVTSRAGASSAVTSGGRKKQASHDAAVGLRRPQPGFREHR